MKLFCSLLLVALPSYGMLAELKKKFEQEAAAVKADEQKIAQIIRHPTVVAEKEAEELEDQVAIYVADKVSEQVRALIIVEMKRAFAQLT